MKSLLLLGTVLLVCLPASTGMAQDTLWTKTYQGVIDDYESGNVITETADNGFILSATYGDLLYLIKTNASGDSTWTNTYLPGCCAAVGRAVLPTADGGYVVGGEVLVDPEPPYDIRGFLLKTDADGDSLWCYTYGGEGTSTTEVRETTDNGFIVAGGTGPMDPPGLRDAYLLKVDADGQTDWSRTYGGSYDDAVGFVDLTDDGGYIFLGSTMSYGADSPNSTDAWIIKTNALGDSSWTKVYGQPGYFDCWLGGGINQTADGGYIMVMGVADGDRQPHQIVVQKLDVDGDSVWAKAYDIAAYVVRARPTSDGGSIIAGFTEVPFETDINCFLMRTDADGDSLWTQTYGDLAYADYLYEAIETTDGHIMAIGETRTLAAPPHDNPDIWLLKVDGGGAAVGAGFHGPVHALTVFQGELIAGGNFGSATADSIDMSDIAAWDGASWRSVGMIGVLQSSPEYVWDMLVDDNKLYVAGDFSEVNGLPTSNIAVWSGANFSDWSALGSGVNGTISDIAIFDVDIAVCGFFSTAGGVPANQVAKWNGSSWSAFGSGPSLFAASALAVYEGNLIVAGDAGIESWNGASWTSIGSTGGDLFGLTAYNLQLVAGGCCFSSIGGISANDIARWDGGTWSAFGSGLDDGGAVPSVWDLFVYQGDLIAAGNLTSAGGSPANRIAAWNGSGWETLGQGLGEVGVFAMTEYNGRLIAGGDFSVTGSDLQVGGLAVWDGVEWAALAPGSIPDPPGVVSTGPAQNELHVAIDSDISVTFDLDINAASVTSSSFVVHANQSGLHTGAISYDIPSRTATLDPDDDFAVGEVVSVTLTTGITSGGVPMERGYHWSFTVAASGGSGAMTLDNAYGGMAGPRACCVADFDNDGDMDIAVAHTETGSVVTILENLGSGTFQSAPTTPPTLSVGSRPRDVIAADFDSDGLIDIAAVSQNDNVLSVRVNGGGWDFSDNRTYLGDGGFHSLCATDIDMDGDLDIAVAVLDSWKMRVYTNNGQAVFTLDSVYHQPTEAYAAAAIIATDVDRDGAPDLVTANKDDGSNNVLVWRNLGNGVFEKAGAFETTSGWDGPWHLVAADLDGDGNSDLATANVSSNDLAVLWNGGDGSFGAYQAFGNTPTGEWIEAADFNGDGLLDLASANWGNSYFSLFLNNGDRTFGPADFGFRAGSTPSALVAADFENDGDMDLAVAAMGSGDIIVLLNNAGAQVTPIEIDSAQVLNVATADLDLDAYTDVIYVGDTDVGLFVAWGQNTDPPIGAGDSIAEITNASLGVFHLNSDTIPDILAVANDWIYSALNNDDRTFTRVASPNSGSYTGAPAFAAGYFDPDAYLDLAVAPDQLYLGDGAGTFAYDSPLGFSFSAAAVGDLNNDGKDDLVVIEDDSAAIYLGDGLTGFAKSDAAFVGLESFSLSSVISGVDLNHDRLVDIVVSVAQTGTAADSSVVMALAGDGAGNLAPLDTLVIIGSSPQVSLSDVDRDNSLDIVVSNASTGFLEIYYSRADNQYGDRELATVGTADELLFALASADLDRDGQPDFVSGSASGSNMVISTSDLPDLPVLADEMFVTGYDYVDITVTNPNNFVISRSLLTVAGSNYYRLHADDDFLLDARTYDYNLQYGEYVITVRLRPDAPPGGEFGIGIGVDGSRIMVIASDYSFDVPPPKAAADVVDSMVFYYFMEDVSSIYPENGQKASCQRPPFKWHLLVADDPPGGEYRFQLGEFHDFREPLLHDVPHLAEAAFRPDDPLNANTVYYWRVLTSWDGGSSYSDTTRYFAAYVGEDVIDCCDSRVGDANLSGGMPTIGDIADLIDMLYITRTEVDCIPEADVNQSGGCDPDARDITIGDIAELVDYLFITGPELGVLLDCL